MLPNMCSVHVFEGGVFPIGFSVWLLSLHLTLLAVRSKTLTQAMPAQNSCVGAQGKGCGYPE